MSAISTPELFRHFPDLRERIPWVPLVRATRVHRLLRLESHLRAAPIWIKRDDQTSDLFGGDKARKFEFVLGDVLRRGAPGLVAFGRLDSRHCLAAAMFAQHFHLRPILALVSGGDAGDAQRVLEMEHALGAELHRLDGGARAMLRLAWSLAGHRRGAERARPHVLWPRRTAMQGALGYVNAAYELQRQIAVGVLPEPERIYVPVESGVTLAGLALGCRLARIRSQLVGVQVASGRRAAPERLATRTAGWLRRRSHHVHVRDVRRTDVPICRDYAGASRAAAQHATGLLHDLESLELGTHGGAMAALVDDVRCGRVEGPVLFWQTHPTGVLARHREIQLAPLPREFRELFVAR